MDVWAPPWTLRGVLYVKPLRPYRWKAELSRSAWEPHSVPTAPKACPSQACWEAASRLLGGSVRAPVTTTGNSGDAQFFGHISPCSLPCSTSCPWLHLGSCHRNRLILNRFTLKFRARTRRWVGWGPCKRFVPPAPQTCDCDLIGEKALDRCERGCCSEMIPGEGRAPGPLRSVLDPSKAREGGTGTQRRRDAAGDVGGGTMTPVGTNAGCALVLCVDRAQAHRTSSSHPSISLLILPSLDPANSHVHSVCFPPPPPPPRFPHAAGSAGSDSASPSLPSPPLLSPGSQTAADTRPRDNRPFARLSVPLRPHLSDARGAGGFVLPAPSPLGRASLPDPHQQLPVALSSAPNAQPACDCPGSQRAVHMRETFAQGPASGGGACSEGARGARGSRRQLPKRSLLSAF